MLDKRKSKLRNLKLKFTEFMKMYPLGVDNLVNENWLDIVGYEGAYQVSNFGRIKSFKRKKPHILRPSLDSGGYMNVVLSKNGVMKNHNVHVLVARAFIPNLYGKPEVNHEDGNKWNNHADNLV